MVSPEEAAGLMRLNVRWIYRLIEAGALHFQETAAGSVWICLESLRRNLSPPEEGRGPDISL
jgi:hypothetical protein